MTERDASLTVQAIAEQLGCELVGDGSAVVSGIGTLESANAEQITFLANRKYASQLETTQAAAVLVTEAMVKDCPVAALVCNDPYLSYAKLSALFEPAFDAGSGTHPSAEIHHTAKIHPAASVGAYCVIGANCTVAEGAIVGPLSVLESGCQLGENSVLRASVTLYRDTVVGNHCLLHAGTVIGADGFGIAWAGDGWQKIAQLGRVVIGDRVEIGANTTIDRGAIQDTIIADGVKLDNLVQIGHNCQIGENTAMAGQSGMAGSSSLGGGCLIGGQVGIAGHLTITNGVTVMQDNGVLSNISDSGQYSMGFGVLPAAKNRRAAVRVKQLDDMARKLRSMEQRLADLESASLQNNNDS